MRAEKVAATAITALAICMLSWAPWASAGDEANSASAPDATISLTNFQAATVEIGQADFAHNDVNQNLISPAADTISSPYGNASVGSNGALYLGDTGNHRVLGFLSFPSSNDASADFVLGQPDFSSSAGGDGADQFGEPQTTIAYKSMLIVDDFFNNRVLIWKNLPTTNQVPADLVLGQTGFGLRDTSCSATGMSAPETISVGGGKLVVGDSSNNRVLIWKKIPKTSGRKADIVLGQKNFTTCVENNNGSGAGGAPSQTNLGYPAGVWTDGKRLVVNDADNNRLMIWKKFPKKNFQKADIVIGQPNFTSSAANNDGSGATGAPSAMNLDFPYDGVFSNGTQLFLTDNENSRVLVWNSFPTHNFQPADIVLGQPNFTCGIESNDGTGCVKGTPTAQNMQKPRGVYQSNGHLIVTDGPDHRYLIF